MVEKFKVGDRIRRKEGHRFSSGNEAEITKITLDKSIGHRLYILNPSSGEKHSWLGKYCELIEKEEEQEKLCRCDLQVLMSQGCQCGYKF